LAYVINWNRRGNELLGGGKGVRSYFVLAEKTLFKFVEGCFLKESKQFITKILMFNSSGRFSLRLCKATGAIGLRDRVKAGFYRNSRSEPLNKHRVRIWQFYRFHQNRVKRISIRLLLYDSVKTEHGPVMRSSGESHMLSAKQL
jgi:hypothetical protein